MKGAQILLDTLAGRSAAALMRDGRLHDLLVDPPDHVPRIGGVYRGRVGRPMKGLGGRIIELSDGATGFLRQGKDLRAGQSLLVQISGHAEPGKAVPLTARLLFKSRYAIVTPDAPGLNISRSIRDEELRVALREIAEDAGLAVGLGLILRSAAADAEPDDISADITDTAALATAVLAEVDGPPELLLDGPAPDLLAWREWVDVPAHDVVTQPRCFETHGALDQIEALCDPEEPLPDAGRFFVEPTRALIAIDVNTDGDTSPAAGLKANLATARALPRALRLRGLGGQIVLDLAPMPKKDRRTFEQTLRSAFKADSIETNLVGWTPLGHFELQRKRERLPLAEALA